LHASFGEAPNKCFELMTPHNASCEYIFITRVAWLGDLPARTIDNIHYQLRSVGYGPPRAEIDSHINIITGYSEIHVAI
jgi:hypothetical protein